MIPGLDAGPMFILLSVVRDAHSVWNEMDANNRDKVDAIVRKVVTVLPTPPELESVIGYLANGTDPLPARLAGAALHPSARNWFSGVPSQVVPPSGGFRIADNGDIVPA